MDKSPNISNHRRAGTCPGNFKLKKFPRYGRNLVHWGGQRKSKNERMGERVLNKVKLLIR